MSYCHSVGAQPQVLSFAGITGHTDCIDDKCIPVQGFWDAVTLMSQHRRDDAPAGGAPQRTKSVAPTLTKLHEQKLAAQALAQKGQS